MLERISPAAFLAMALAVASAARADPGGLMGSGNICTTAGVAGGKCNHDRTGDMTVLFAALNTAGAGTGRITMETYDYYDDTSSTVLYGGDSVILQAAAAGINPLVHFEWNTIDTTPLGSYAKWYAVGQGYAARYAPNSAWLVSNGVTNWGVTTMEAINEPDIQGPLVNSKDYHDALQGLGEGAHAASATMLVNPAGFYSPSGGNYNMSGLGPAIADLWNNGTLNGIDLHMYYDTGTTALEGTYTHSAQYTFEQVKKTCGITRDINYNTTETAVPANSLASDYLTSLWDNLGTIHNDGTPAARAVLTWNLYATTANDPTYGLCDQLQPWTPNARGQVLQTLAQLTKGMQFLKLDPDATGEYVLASATSTMWVWQDCSAWTNHPGTTYTVTNIPAGATKIDVWGWNKLRSTVQLTGTSTTTITGLPGSETYMFVANAGSAPVGGSDGGVTSVDGGTALSDAGARAPDGGGIVARDGGLATDGGATKADGGETTDGGIVPSDAGPGETVVDGGDTADGGPNGTGAGCSCQSSGGGLLVDAGWLVAMMGLLARRRRS